MLDLDGISDGLAVTLAHELNLHRRISSDAYASDHQRHQQRQQQAPLSTSRCHDFDYDGSKASGKLNGTSDAKNAIHCRTLLAEFASSHAQAERALSRLILKHLGISRAVLREHHSIFDTNEVDAVTNNPNLISEDGTTAGIVTKPNTINEDIIPHLCPVPWLSQAAWHGISFGEKVELMEVAILALSHPSASVRYRMYPSTSKYSDSFAMFGRGSVDRVVLGHGPRHVLVLVGIHGNEPCGVEAARLILQRHCLLFRTVGSAGDSGLLATKAELEDDSNWNFPLSRLFEEMTIEFIVGNPKAVAANQRFLQRNLNRLLDVHTLCDEKAVKGGEYEIQRARVLYEAIRHSDAVLDIHSVSSDSDPFAIPASTDASEAIAPHLPVSYIVQSLAHSTAEGGTSMDCALMHDVPAVCVECGQHNHEDIVARAADVISAFLLTQYGGEKPRRCVELAKHSKNALNGSNRPIVMRCEGIEIVHEGFEWMKPFTEFEWIPYDSPVFKDKVRGVVTCPIEPGSYLVMPTKIPVVGEEALFWARAAGMEEDGGNAVSEEPQ